LSIFKITTLNPAGNSVNLGFPTVAGRFYQGYSSSDLLTWTRDDTQPTVSGDGNPASWPFSPIPVIGVKARYYRIAVGGSAGAFPATVP
jgi:hypothetical protein